MEVRGGDGRGLRGTHGNPNAPQTHLQMILGSWGFSSVVKAQYVGRVRARALLRDAGGRWKRRDAAAHARGNSELSDRATVDRQRCSREN